MRDRGAFERNGDYVPLCGFKRFAYRFGDFGGFAEAVAHMAGAVAHYYKSRETGYTSAFDGLANSVVATMKLQRVASTDKFTEFLNELKEIIKNPDYRNKFDTFMTFLRRYLSVVFDNDKYNHVNALEEIIKMTKSFRDYDRENDLEEGKLELLTSMIKKGILTLKQAADKMNMTIPQFEEAVKNLAV